MGPLKSAKPSSPPWTRLKLEHEARIKGNYCRHERGDVASEPDDFPISCLVIWSSLDEVVDTSP